MDSSSLTLVYSGRQHRVASSTYNAVLRAATEFVSQTHPDCVEGQITLLSEHCEVKNDAQLQKLCTSSNIAVCYSGGIPIHCSYLALGKS